MHVKDMMNTDVLTTPPDTNFETLMCKQACLPYRMIYVVDSQNRLKGVITSYDILAIMVPSYLDANLAKAVADDASIFHQRFKENAAKTAKDIMHTDFIALKPEHHVIEANAQIRKHGFNMLPVLDADGRLVGEVSRKNLIQYLALNVCGLSCEMVRGTRED